MTTNANLSNLQATWKDSWPEALADWSPYVQLHQPHWCLTEDDEQRENLSGSFAMIRLRDHTVVISLHQINQLGLQQFALEILAHEIGHHVYCPADLTDNARLLARVRRGLPGCESYAPMVANLYSDLLINDRLKRQRGRNIAGVYQAIRTGRETGDLWQLYMRTYELLWNLPPQTLTTKDCTERLNQDALLASRLIRIYSRDWLSGAGRFACLILPYVTEESESATRYFRAWCDTVQAGTGVMPTGLVEIDDDELSGAIHPAEDPELSGLDSIDMSESGTHNHGRVPAELSGRKTLKSFRSPFEYSEILKASGVQLSEREIAVQYYRERALPYLIPFPSQSYQPSFEQMPEGLDLWETGEDLHELDWFGSLTASPLVVPGVTTRQRRYADSPGNDPERQPINLYLGVDCSGSMGDPAHQLSYPILAGTVISLSALRAGAYVKIVLSGEPGKTVSTDGFIREQPLILKTLLNYLGTGYSFGIHRLAETFSPDKRLDRPCHILIVSDYDMFPMLDESGGGRLGWDVARQAIQHCGGGGTFVLQLPGYETNYKQHYESYIERMQTDGWEVHLVNSMEELIDFSRKFSRLQYQIERKDHLYRGTHAG